MELILLLFILIVFAVALMPEFTEALNVAQSSWPEGAFMLGLIPSPIEFVLLVLVAVLILLAGYLTVQLTQ